MPFTFSLALGMALLVLGTPIAVALIATTVVFLLIDPQVPLVVVPQRLLAAVDSFPLMAVPFFVLVGHVMNVGGITDRIFAFANCLVGHVRGGLGHVNVTASLLMSGMSGSAVADASGLGQVEIRAMVRQGYDPAYAAALTASSATIGPIVPPSIPFVIFGSIAGVSVSQLLLAGIVPGLLMGLGLMLVNAIVARRRGYPVRPRASLGELGRTFVEALPALLTPVILVGGIVSGVFTPTEASAVAAIYSIVVAMAVYRALTPRGFVQVLIDSSIVVGAIFFIIGAAAVMSWMFTWLNVPQTLAALLGEHIGRFWLLLILINLFLIAIGCFLEANAALILTTPLLYPIALEAGIDPVHFGVILVMNLMLGLITPPVGLNMYIVSAIAGVSIPAFLRANAPFFLILVAVLGLITFWPPLSLFVPSLFFR